MKPSWCAKPKPCDYDAGSAYCLHRECRSALEKIVARFEAIVRRTTQHAADCAVWQGDACACGFERYWPREALCAHDGSQQHVTGDEWVRCTQCGAPLSRAPSEPIEPSEDQFYRGLRDSAQDLLCGGGHEWIETTVMDGVERHFACSRCSATRTERRDFPQSGKTP